MYPPGHGGKNPRGVKEGDPPPPIGMYPPGHEAVTALVAPALTVTLPPVELMNFQGGATAAAAGGATVTSAAAQVSMAAAAVTARRRLRMDGVARIGPPT